MKQMHSNIGEKYDWIQYNKDKFNSFFEEAKNKGLLNEEEIEIINSAYSLFDKYLESYEFVLIHNDLHFDNMSVIRNVNTGKIRVAPIYDLAGAFGTSRHGREMLSNITKSTYFLIYYLFSGLDPTWDYSWYNKDNLTGFEEEIRDILSKSDFYTPELIERVIEVFHQQKASLDELSGGK